MVHYKLLNFATMQQLNKDITTTLVRNGFTENEANIYIVIAKLGKANAIEIAHSLKIDKTSVYRSAEKLIDLGLIARTGNKYGNQLFIDDINQLTKFFESKRSSAENDLLTIKEFLQNLPLQLDNEFLKTKVKVFKGPDVVKDLYELRIQEGKNLIREVSTSDVQLNLTPGEDAYWEDYIKRRIDSGAFLHMLIDKTDSSKTFHRTNKEQFKEVRIVPDDFLITSGLNIFNNKVAIHNTKSIDIIGIVIEDKSIADLLINFFDFIWKRSQII